MPIGEEVEELRERASVQRIGRPRPTDEIPPQEAKKSPFSLAASSLNKVPFTPLASERMAPQPWERCSGRSLSSGVQGL